MGILEVVVYGFFTAFGWWGANHYVIEPYFPPPIERKENKEESNDRTKEKDKT
jgi:hypothetical protein